jgi:hypothetical protein
MASAGRRDRFRGKNEGDKDQDDREPERHHENESSDEGDNPAEHLEIERRRFAGGLPPTPDLYALAREQWYRLPGVVARPSMDPVIEQPVSDNQQQPDRAHPDQKEAGQ